MNVNLINDIINDFSKLYDELYKKRYSSLNTLLDKSKKDLNAIKEKISSNQFNDEQNKDKILSEKTTNLISCIKAILQNKLNKYVIDFLNILKKCIQYKLWSKLNSHITIDIMKEISVTSKVNLESLNKVVEVIHTIIFTSFFELNETDAINIYLINIKIFNCTNNYQNYNFKNPIRLLFIALTDIIYKSNNNEIIINITRFLFSLYIKDDINNNNEYFEIIKDIKNNVYLKCLSLELLSQGFKIFKEKNADTKYLEEIIKNKMTIIIKNNLNKIKKQKINNDQEYIHLLKLLKFAMIILNDYNIDFDIITLIINFLGDDSKIPWQKSLSMECLLEILNNCILLVNLFNYNKEILINIYAIFGTVYEQNKTNISKYNTKAKPKKQNKKQINNNIIYLQGDEISIIKENEIYNNIINNIKECIQNSINSFNSMMLKNKILLDKINIELSKEQKKIKEIIKIPSNIFKQILFDLIEKEYNNKEYDDSDLQKTINLIQNIIILYSSLNMIEIRNEYLTKICQISLEFNNEKNIIICSSILSLSKFTQFFNKKEFIIIFQTIEKIYIKYNTESKKNYDLIIENIFKSYQKFFSENDSINKDIEYKNEKKEKENLLISTINNMFIDSKSINISVLKNILEALFECLNIEINENIEKSESKSKDQIIIFYLTKLLTLALLNIENIYYIYDDYIIPIINLLKQKKIILIFLANLISTLIKEILFNHQKIILNLKSENINNNWLLNSNWQKKLFEPLISFVQEKDLITLTKGRLLICIKSIVQQCGNYIDLFGWESIFKICQILIKDNIEEIFFIIKLILTDYNAYLTIFNIIPIINSLSIFISYQKDNNICFNSIELFWSCANIVEKFHKGKTSIKDFQTSIFEDLLKEEKAENFDIFYSKLYYQIFSKLLKINSDSRYEIRKNGINIFTEIFVSKLISLEYKDTFKIINEIFFNIFVINSKKYIDKEKSFNSQEKEGKNKINSNDKNDNELEMTLHTSLISMIKILKSFSNVNLDKKEEADSLKSIFVSFLNKIKEIIPYGTIILNSDILHGLSEIKNIKISNVLILPSRLDIFFEIMDKFGEYVHSERFILTPYNKMQCIRMINNLIINLNDIFLIKSNFDIFNMKMEEIFSKIFNILKFVFYTNFNLEFKTLEYSPKKLTEIEENVFNFVENIPIYNEDYIFNYLLEFINYNIKDTHSGAKCKRAIECLTYIIDKSDGNCLILKKEKQTFLFDIINKLKGLFYNMKNIQIKEYLKINNNKNNTMFNELIRQISKFFLSVINKNEINSDDLIIKIIEFYQYISNQIINELKVLNEISFIKELKDLY